MHILRIRGHNVVTAFYGARYYDCVGNIGGPRGSEQQARASGTLERQYVDLASTDHTRDERTISSVNLRHDGGGNRHGELVLDGRFEDHPHATVALLVCDECARIEGYSLGHSLRLAAAISSEVMAPCWA